MIRELCTECIYNMNAQMQLTRLFVWVLLKISTLSIRMDGWIDVVDCGMQWLVVGYVVAAGPPLILTCSDQHGLRMLTTLHSTITAQPRHLQELLQNLLQGSKMLLTLTLELGMILSKGEVDHALIRFHPPNLFLKYAFAAANTILAKFSSCFWLTTSINVL